MLKWKQNRRFLALGLSAVMTVGLCGTMPAGQQVKAAGTAESNISAEKKNSAEKVSGGEASAQTASVIGYGEGGRVTPAPASDEERYEAVRPNDGSVPGSVSIDEANFPDEGFRKYLKENVGNHDNVLTQEELDNTTSMVIDGQYSITDFTGLSYFGKLDSFKYENAYSAPEEIDFSGNPELVSVEISGSGSPLAKVDFSGCTKIETLKITNCALVELDTSGMAGLTTLECQNNKLKALDLTNNTKLDTLFVYDNALADVTGLSAVGSLTYVGFGTQLPEVTVEQKDGVYSAKSTLLRDIVKKGLCGDDSILCYAEAADDGVSWAVNPMKGTRSLMDWSVSSLPVNIGSETYSLSVQPTFVNEYEEEGTGEEETFEAVELSKANFPNLAFRRFLKNSFDADNDDTLSADECRGITDINLNYWAGNYEKVTDFTGLKYFKNLETFTVNMDCNYSEGGTLSSAESIDFSQNPKLRSVSVWNTYDLSSLNFSGCSELKRAEVYSANKLAEIDFTGCFKLRKLTIQNALLTKGLKTSDFPFLSSLICSETSMKELDLTKNKKLTLLELRNNNSLASELDLGNCAPLSSLVLENNRNLSGLVLGEKENLTVMSCTGSKITSLDVSGLTGLRELDCAGNRLSSLDISGLDELKTVDISNNCFSEMPDIGGLKKLTKLTGGSQTVSFDIVKNGEGKYEIKSELLKKIDMDNVPEDSILKKAEKTETGVCWAEMPFADTKVLEEDEEGQAVSYEFVMDGDNNWIETVPVKFYFVFVNQYQENLPEADTELKDVPLTAFEDEVFRAYVNENYNTDKDDVLSAQECGNVTYISLSCSEYDISSFKGIEAFKNLTSFEYNGSEKSKLKVLDLSGNPELTYVNASRNNNLSSLNLAGCRKLESLYAGGCALTDLASLAGCKKLKYLDVSGNRLTELPELPAEMEQCSVYSQNPVYDVKKDAEGGIYYVKSAVLRDAVKAMNSANSDKVPDAEAEAMALALGGTILADAVATEDGVSWTEDPLEGIPLLTGEGWINHETGITDSSGDKVTATFNLSFRNTYGDFTDTPARTDVELDEANFPDEKFREYLEDSADANNNNVLEVSEIENIKNLYLYDKGIGSLKGIEYLYNLSTLEASYNNLESVDLGQNKLLREVRLYYNSPLVEVIFPEKAVVQTLDVGNCRLSQIDMGRLPRLKSLNCSGNQIHRLDISGAKYLTSLDCSYNKLQELDLSRAEKLTELRCLWGNALGPVDTSALKNLTYTDLVDEYYSEARYVPLKYVEDEEEGGIYKIDLSGFGKLDKEKFSVENWYEEENPPHFAEDGIWWDTDLFLTTPEMGYRDAVDLYLVYDLSNGTELLKDKKQKIYFRIVREEDFDVTEVEINEENFPDEGFRTILRNQYGSTFMPGIQTYLSLYGDVRDLAGIEFFKNLTSIDFGSECENLKKADLRALRKLRNVYMYNSSVSALYLNEEVPKDIYISSPVPFETEAVQADDGRYMLDLGQVVCFDEARVFDLNLRRGTLDGKKVYWDKDETSVPLSISYKFALREDYDPDKEYTYSDYITVTVNLANNAPERPQSRKIELSEENFPDDNFRTFLKDQYAKGGNILDTASVKHICLYYNGTGYECNGREYKTFTDLKGIELLNRLESVEIPNLAAETVDLSKNTILSSVRFMNGSLTRVDLSGEDGEPGCRYLQTLDLSGNSLSEIDISKCTYLMQLNLEGNSLSELTLTGNDYLTDLNVGSNSLISLELLGAADLKTLYFSNNPRLKKLDLTGNTYLEILDVSQCESLEELILPEEPHLVGISLGRGKYEIPDLTKIKTLKYVSAYGIPLKDSLSNIPNLVTVYYQTDSGAGMQGEDFSVLNFSRCPKLREVSIWDDGGFLKTISVNGCSELQYLYLSNVRNLENLDASGCGSLSTLNCYEASNLKSLRLNGAESLTNLNLYSGQLTSLDVSSCIRLTDLRCAGQQLETLSLSGAAALKYLDVSGNKLLKLDVSECPALQSLYCSGNRLPTVDVSKNVSLKYFDCSSNPIRKMDLSNNKALLTDFVCTDGSLTSLDVSENENLENIDVGNQVMEVTTDDLVGYEPEESPEPEEPDKTASPEGDATVPPESSVTKKPEVTPSATEGSEEEPDDVQPEETDGPEIEEPGVSPSAGQEDDADDERNEISVKNAPITRAVQTSAETPAGGVCIDLARYGDFDSAKVKNLSSGTLTEQGISWASTSAVPETVTYDYDISNQYKLKNMTMKVTLNTSSLSNATLPTARPRPTVGPTAGATQAPVATAIPRPTEGTVTAAPTAVPTATPAETASPTETASLTETPAQTPAATASAVPTAVPTLSPAPAATEDDGDDEEDEDGSSSVSSSKKPTVKKVSGVKASVNSAKKQIILKWKKLSGAAGYRLQISTARTFKGAKYITVKSSKTKYIFKKLRKKKLYYIRICAYKKYQSKKVYGKYVTLKKKLE